MNAISPMPSRPRQRLVYAPRLEKIVELLVHLAQTKPGRDQYQAVKLFYLADREHLRRHGRPMTYETYYALEYGPVATTVLNLVQADAGTLRRAGIARLPIRIERDGKIYRLADAERAADLKVLSRSDIAVFDEIVRIHGDSTFDDLYELTHDHPAYRMAWAHKTPSQKRSLMYYEDMLDEGDAKDDLLDDMAPVSRHLR